MAELQTNHSDHVLVTVTKDGADAVVTVDPRVGLTIVETSTGVWNGDAPARTAGAYPITFVADTDPEDATNGIATPANINDGDTWIPKSSS